MDPAVLKNKLLLIQQINQIQLIDEDVICRSCKQHWISPEMCKFDNGFMCKDCADEIFRITIKMSKFISNLLFPCVHCDQYFGKYFLLQKHMDQCIFRRKECKNCDLLVNDLEIQEHLRVRHQMEIRIINESALDISVELFSNIPRFYSVGWSHQDCQKTFIVGIEKKDDLMQVDVYTEEPDAADNVPFKIVYQDEEEIGRIRSMSHLFAETVYSSSADIFNMKLPVEGRINLRLHFGIDDCNYKVSECPICMCTLTAKIYLCKNGHSLCSNCFRNIATCGMCREPAGVSQLNLSTLLPNLMFPCENANLGCMLKLNSNQMDLHKNKCKYKTVTCYVCKKVQTKFLAHKHYMECHPGDISNRNTTVSYLVSNDLVFRAERQQSSFPVPSNFYNFRLLHDDTNCALRYRYEMQFFKHNDSIIADWKIGAKCQRATDTSFSSVIALDKIEGLRSHIFITEE